MSSRFEQFQAHAKQQGMKVDMVMSLGVTPAGERFAIAEIVMQPIPDVKHDFIGLSTDKLAEYTEYLFKSSVLVTAFLNKENVNLSTDQCSNIMRALASRINIRSLGVIDPTKTEKVYASCSDVIDATVEAAKEEDLKDTVNSLHQIIIEILEAEGKDPYGVANPVSRDQALGRVKPKSESTESDNELMPSRGKFH